MTRFSTLLRLEWRRALRDPALFALIAVYVLLAGVALHTGRQWATDRAGMLRLVEQEVTGYNETYRAALEEQRRSGKRPPFPAMFPSALSYRATLPNAPLAAVSSGQAESHAPAAHVAPLADPWRIFDRFEAGFENPSVMAAGRFDLGFVIVTIMPLLLLAALYDHWVAERERGLARLQLAEPVSAFALAGSKALARGALVLGGMALSTAVLVPLLTGAGPAGLGGILAVLLLYGGFWAALALLVNALVRRATVAALACGAAWLAVVLLVPLLAAAVVDRTAPPPSAVAHFNAMRDLETRIRVEQRAALPTLPPMPAEITAIPDRLRVVRREAGERDARTAPPNARHEAAVERRAKLAEALRFLSPATVAQAALDRIAGTDARRALAFRAQARDFAGETRAFSDRLFDENRLLRPADFEPGGLPAFRFGEPPRRLPAALDLGALATATLLAAALAALRFRRAHHAL